MINGFLMLGLIIIGIVVILFFGYLEFRVFSVYGRDLRNVLYSKV